MINHISFPNLGWEFEINRIAFSVFGMPVYLYGVIIALGLLLAFLYGVYEAKRVGLSQDDLLNMLLIGIPAAIVCARAYYVAFEWDSYKNNLAEIFNIRGGGIAIYGAVIGVAVSVFFYCRAKKLNMGKVLDLLAVGLLIGQSIGRWGNFVNGEAFGVSCNLPWAMTIVNEGRTVAEMAHPTFFYESLWNGLGLVVLLLFRKHKAFEGEVFCGYMIWYGIGRMFIEGLRTDSLYIGIFRVSQLLSGVLVVVGIILIVINRKNLKKTLDK
ncbi:MAG: prolipoprotein diacylglyceryl transferase [Ruminococcaceae bacterium]|nr:prolipoprotein diacylglyceryl transferase [Oscillospiraceae bacterium]